MPLSRARELWKKRREDRRRWRIVELSVEEGRGCEENVKLLEGFERVMRFVV